MSPVGGGGAFLVLGSPQSPYQRNRTPEGFGDSPGVRLVYRLELLDELRALFLTTGKPRLESRYRRLERRYLRLERWLSRPGAIQFGRAGFGARFRPQPLSPLH